VHEFVIIGLVISMHGLNMKFHTGVQLEHIFNSQSSVTNATRLKTSYFAS